MPADVGRSTLATSRSCCWSVVVINPCIRVVRCKLCAGCTGEEFIVQGEWVEGGAPSFGA